MKETLFVVAVALFVADIVFVIAFARRHPRQRDVGLSGTRKGLVVLTVVLFVAVLATLAWTVWG